MLANLAYVCMYVFTVTLSNVKVRVRVSSPLVRCRDQFSTERGILSRAAEFACFHRMSIFLRNFILAGSNTDMPYFVWFQAAIG